MKRIITFILTLALALSLIACSSEQGASTPQTTEAGDTTASNTGREGSVIGGENNLASITSKVLEPMEYTLYTNIFYNGTGGDYVNQKFTKEGTYARIYDNFYDKYRYYVWGYADNTLCCDWQWEFVPTDVEALPSPGSRVKMTGTFLQSEDALDGYWYDKATVEVIEEFKGELEGTDLTTLSPTLTRVQLVNMVQFPTNYNEKPIRVYGRIASDNTIQHPYYDNAWVVALEYDGELPPIGSWVTLEGTFSGTYNEDCKMIAENLIVE